MKIFLILFLLFPFVAIAGQQYDVNNQKWVTVPDRTHDGSQQDRDNTRVETFNPTEGTWSLEKPDAKPEYNPMTNKFEFPE